MALIYWGIQPEEKQELSKLNQCCKIIVHRQSELKSISSSYVQNMIENIVVILTSYSDKLYFVVSRDG